MKKWLKVLSTIGCVLMFSGCFQPVYEDNFERVELKNVKKGRQKGYFWTRKHTLYTPIDSDFISQDDLRLLKEEPKPGDTKEIFKKALLLHENAHSINDQSFKWMLRFTFFPKKARWMTEQEGYGTEIIYLLKKGVRFDSKTVKRYIRNMLSDIYHRMTTKEEATDFVLDLVSKYSKLRIAGDGLSGNEDLKKYFDEIDGKQK